MALCRTCVSRCPSHCWQLCKACRVVTCYDVELPEATSKSCLSNSSEWIITQTNMSRVVWSRKDCMPERNLWNNKRACGLSNITDPAIPGNPGVFFTLQQFHWAKSSLQDQHFLVSWKARVCQNFATHAGWLWHNGLVKLSSKAQLVLPIESGPEF